MFTSLSTALLREQSKNGTLRVIRVLVVLLDQQVHRNLRNRYLLDRRPRLRTGERHLPVGVRDTLFTDEIETGFQMFRQERFHLCLLHFGGNAVADGISEDLPFAGHRRNIPS